MNPTTEELEKIAEELACIRHPVRFCGGVLTVIHSATLSDFNGPYQSEDGWTVRNATNEDTTTISLDDIRLICACKCHDDQRAQEKAEEAGNE